jgi:hypothetical protein
MFWFKLLGAGGVSGSVEYSVVGACVLSVVVCVREIILIPPLLIHFWIWIECSVGRGFLVLYVFLMAC